MNSDTCFIISGILEEEYITPLLKSFSSIQHKIYSTWKSLNSNHIERLQKAGFRIVLNDEPVVKTSTNFQNICVSEGCKRAKELGYKYCIRTRTDIWSWNFIQFANSTRIKYTEKLTVLCGETSIDGKNNHYIHDTIVCGPVNDMIKFWSPLQLAEDLRFPEKFIQEEWTKKEDLTREDIYKSFHFCIQEARKEGIQIIWNPKKGLFELIFDLTVRPWFFDSA